MGLGSRPRLTMPAFTTITSDTDLFQVDLINEIVRGVWERWLVSVNPHAGEPSYYEIAVGRDVQHEHFWRYHLQEWLEFMADWPEHLWEPFGTTVWLDHEAGYGQNVSDWPPLTLARMREIAGIPKGFRRAKAWDPRRSRWTNYTDRMFSYGTMQPGDIPGPWILVDLQRALSAFRWTRLSPSGFADFEYRKGDSSNKDTCEEAVAAQAADYRVIPAAGFASNYSVLALLTESNVHWAFASRQRSKAQFSSSGLAALRCAIDVYGLIGEWHAGTFSDIDGLGCELGKWHRFLQIPAPAVPVSPVTTDWLTAETSNPFPASGLACPISGDRSIVTSSLLGVCKWVFSNY